jgi:membrane protein implicated in regulation of membrane protease activity
MSGASATVPDDWRELFAGRNVAFAGLPPPPVKPVRGFTRVFAAALPLLIVTGIGVGVSLWLASATGRWWIGLIVFGCFGFVMALLAVGFVGAIAVEQKDRERRRARALEDPIGKLLPTRGAGRAKFNDPSSYAGLFALEPRPVLILDTALFGVMPRGKFATSLAPRGRLPEPEILPTSSIPGGTSIFGMMLIFQSMQFWTPAFIAARAGAPLGWRAIVGVVMIAVAVYLIVRDPWLRRRLHLPRMFGADSVIGAGWIRDGKGEVWTVDESILLLSLSQNSMEARLIKPTKVHVFYLPIVMGAPLNTRSKPSVGITGLGIRARTKRAAVEAAKGAAESVGIEAESAEVEMPGPKEPLRLLLSSWTYPEPRTDLAMPE